MPRASSASSVCAGAGEPERPGQRPRLASFAVLLLTREDPEAPAHEDQRGHDEQEKDEDPGDCGAVAEVALAEDRLEGVALREDVVCPHGRPAALMPPRREEDRVDERLVRGEEDA